MDTPTDLKEQGLALFGQDKFDEAVARFQQAGHLYAAGGDREAEAEMRNNIAVARLAQKDWEAALAELAGTPECFAGSGNTLRQAQALSSQAAAHEGAGRLDTAAELYELAIDLFRSIDETANRAACWKALSGLQIKQDKKMQALASMQAGLNLSSNLSVREKTLKGLLERAIKMIGGQ